MNIKRNQIWTTNYASNGKSRIFTVRVLNVDTDTDMQTVALITYCYTHRPWEHFTAEYHDFLFDWKLRYDIHFGEYPSEPPEKRGSLSASEHREIHRLRSGQFKFNKIDFTAQPIWDVIEDIRMHLTEERSKLHEIKFAGMSLERCDSAIGGLDMIIVYLYHAAQELKKAHSNDPEGNPR